MDFLSFLYHVYTQGMLRHFCSLALYLTIHLNTPYEISAYLDMVLV